MHVQYTHKHTHARARSAFITPQDWLYQLNDDARLTSKGWEAALAGVLSSNPVAPFLGATGPIDETNQRIFTHVFVHRTHIDIHGRFFPTAFKNYYSDDWISHVYGSGSTFKLPNVRMKHETKAQKTGKIERYQPDTAAKHALGVEVEAGAVRTLKWLNEKGRAEMMPLDAVCGYAPLVEFI